MLVYWTIPCSSLKDCLPTIIAPLLHIFDSSLQAGIFLIPWKHAVIRPLPKVNPPREIGHLRPISTLCASSKILEAVAHQQNSEFVTVDNKQVVLAVAIDYSCAFDCVNVALLIDKLEKLGFFDSANKWIRSFLTNRIQVVSSPSSDVSSLVIRNAGVP